MAGFFTIIHLNFQTDRLNIKSLVTLKYILAVKHTQSFGVLASQNCSFCKNLSPLLHFTISSQKHGLFALLSKFLNKINRPLLHSI